MLREREEIEREIAWLKENKLRVRRITAFGDDNHEAIDCQINVLEAKLDDRTLYDSAYSEHARDAGMQAYQWKFEGDDDACPSENWKPLLVN